MKLVRQVAIDAARHRVVRTLRPGRVLVVHDVAVLAGARIGREVAEPFAVVERECAHAGDGPGQHGEKHRGLPEQEHNAALYPNHLGYHLTTEN